MGNWQTDIRWALRQVSESRGKSGPERDRSYPGVDHRSSNLTAEVAAKDEAISCTTEQSLTATVPRALASAIQTRSGRKTPVKSAKNGVLRLYRLAAKATL